METQIEGLASWELERVAAINTYEQKADVPEAEASDVRWEQARLVVEAIQDGVQQQKLADNWKRVDGRTYSATHVTFVKKAYEAFYYSKERPRWYDAYNSDEVRGKTHVGQNSGENEWYTPPEIIDAAREVMGSIDFDPASSTAANKVVGADDFYTKENSGLDVPWEGRVWLNPPYVADLVARFTEKLCAEYLADNISEAVLLVNNATETAWFQHTAAVANAVCFHAGRISYWHPDRTSKTPLQGQAILYFGANTDKFNLVFRKLGVVFP